MDEFCMYNELQAIIRENELAFDELCATMREYGYDPYNTADEGLS